MTNKNSVAILVAVVIIVAGALLWFFGSKPESTQSPVSVSENVQSVVSTPDTVVSVEADSVDVVPVVVDTAFPATGLSPQP